MKKMTKLGLAIMVAASSMVAVAHDDDDLRRELAEAKAEVAQLQAELKQQRTMAHDTTATTSSAAMVTTDDHNTNMVNHDRHSTANLPAGIYLPENLINVKVDRDELGNGIDIDGEIESGDVRTLAQQARQALLDNGYTVINEDIDSDDEANLTYEKVTGTMRETVEIEIDESWLTDDIEYDVEYEKHN